MYGAIIGDVIGSRFEFDRGPWTKEFELFTSGCKFTDDSVMTTAIAEALINAGTDAEESTIKKELIRTMKDWGNRYPSSGFGGNFYNWLFSNKDPKPYGSWGNGSAMRVSATGWLYDTLERTREVARYTAEVTHNHPEGIKGAECTAAVIYMSRNGSSKEEIAGYVTKEFGYDYSESLEEMRKRHRHDESCMDSLPKALRSFFDGESYEDVVRNAVSLGGDTDTIAAIAGSMAEAFYGIPVVIIAEASQFIPSDMMMVLNEFRSTIGIDYTDDTREPYARNICIKSAVEQVIQSQNEGDYAKLLDVIVQRIMEGGEVPTPMVDKNHVMDSIELKNIKIGDTLGFDQDLRLTIDKMRDMEGNIWTPLYTDDNEVDKGDTPYIRVNMSIMTIIKEAYYYEKSKGLVINPFGQAFTIPKEILKLMIDTVEDNI